MEPIKKALGPVVVNLNERRRFRDQQLIPPRQVVATGTYRCARCKDAGYLRATVPYGDPLFGKAVECECSKAKKKAALRQRLWEQSKIGQLVTFQEASFESFQFWHPGVQEAYEAAEAFANAPQGWLVLQGPNGCGKTHLAVAIAKQCLDSSEATVLFANVPALLKHLRATFSPDAESAYEGEFKKMSEAEVLILDDLGAESNTPWANEELYLLFNYRYEARLATVVTTNRIGLVGCDQRMRSRLRDRRLVRTVVMDAQDFREMEV